MPRWRYRVRVDQPTLCDTAPWACALTSPRNSRTPLAASIVADAREEPEAVTPSYLWFVLSDWLWVLDHQVGAVWTGFASMTGRRGSGPFPQGCPDERLSGTCGGEVLFAGLAD
jgi:hypothetical protein